MWTILVFFSYFFSLHIYWKNSTSSCFMAGPPDLKTSHQWLHLILMAFWLHLLWGCCHGSYWMAKDLVKVFSPSRSASLSAAGSHLHLRKERYKSTAIHRQPSESCSTLDVTICIVWILLTVILYNGFYNHFVSSVFFLGLPKVFFLTSDEDSFWCAVNLFVFLRQQGLKLFIILVVWP